MVNFTSDKQYLLFLVLILISLKICRSLPSTMKAVVLYNYGGPEELVVSNVSLPIVTRGQVLVKVMAAGINPFDIHARNGKAFFKSSLPVILGKEISGVIEQLNHMASRHKVGDRVFCFIEFGGYAEYAAADESKCYALPERLSFSQGAALYMTYFTAYRGLFKKGRIAPNETVLIHGASATLGAAAVQIAKHAGALVVATVGSPALRTLMQRIQPHLIVNHDEAEYLSDALEKIEKPGFDIIFEIIGAIDVAKDKMYLSEQGRIVVLGNRVTVSKYGKGKVYTVSLFKSSPQDTNDAAAYITQGAEDGFISPIIGHEYALEDAANAHFDLGYSKGAFGKLVFLMQ